MVPPLDPIGIVTAIISAAVFTLAIVYMICSKTTDIETPLTAALRDQGARRERELFAGVLLERRLSLRGLALSVALHVSVLAVVPLLPYLFPQRLKVDFRRYSVRTLEFRLPAPLLYTVPGRAGAERAAPPRVALLRTPGAAEARAERARAAAIRKRPQLLIPWSPRVQSRNAVIQPDQPLDVSIPAPDLPTALLWAQAPTPTELSRLVGMPQKIPLPAFSLPQAAPRVQKPNRERAIANLQIGAGPVLTFRAPQLPVLPANVSPIGKPAPGIDAPGELPASALPSGSPTNLIALMQTPAPRAAGYLAGAGNLLAGSQGASLDAAGGSAAGSAAGSPGDKGAGAPGGTAAKGSHADLLAVAGTESDPTAPAGSNNAAADSTNAPAGRGYPTGNLGVIIVQQTSQETALEGGEALSGQPVYTVFFDVPGAPRRWILQYCVPGSNSESPSYVRSPDGIIRIVPKRSVQPPYPIDRIPVDMSGFRGEARRLIVYATVNERGETENVRLVRGTGHEVDRAALATLRRWTFRPATRGDEPVAVEALFGIPLQ